MIRPWLLIAAEGGALLSFTGLIIMVLRLLLGLLLAMTSLLVSDSPPRSRGQPIAVTASVYLLSPRKNGSSVKKKTVWVYVKNGQS